jgi:hypothetical protein
MRFRAFLSLSVLLLVSSAVSGQALMVSLDAEESEATELLAKLNENGAKEGLSFTRAEETYQYRIALAAESVAKKDFLFGGGADASAAVLTPECKLVFAVSRGGRSTKGGAINALSKEIVKLLKGHVASTSGPSASVPPPLERQKTACP